VQPRDLAAARKTVERGKTQQLTSKSSCYSNGTVFALHQADKVLSVPSRAGSRPEYARWIGNQPLSAP
jgi:hypothetical protein